MLVHEFICIRPERMKCQEIDYCFFVKYREDASVIRRWMSLHDDVVLPNCGFKREDFRISGMNAENFYPELMKFFSAFHAYGLNGEKTIGLNYWGITVLRVDTLEEIVRKAEKSGKRQESEVLRFVKFCRDALEQGEWVIHFGV